MPRLERYCQHRIGSEPPPTDVESARYELLPTPHRDHLKLSPTSRRRTGFGVGPLGSFEKEGPFVAVRPGTQGSTRQRGDGEHGARRSYPTLAFANHRR